MNKEPGALLEGIELLKIYHGSSREVRAVDGVSVRAKRGEFLAVAGPSGAGKSTLLHMLGGLDTPTGGKVIFGGIDLFGLKEAQRARMRNGKIGFVFQFYHLLPEFTALENVMLPALMSGTGVSGRRPEGATEERAREILDKVGLGARASHRPGELSGGESQRVAVARALVNAPEALLCDEPTGNLDSAAGGEIIDLLIGLCRSSGTSLVIATHDTSIRGRADSVLYLKDGKVAR